MDTIKIIIDYWELRSRYRTKSTVRSERPSCEVRNDESDDLKIALHLAKPDFEVRKDESDDLKMTVLDRCPSWGNPGVENEKSKVTIFKRWYC